MFLQKRSFLSTGGVVFKRATNVLILGSTVIGLTGASICAQVSGQSLPEKVLINVNPDPNGEPWIAGGITKEEWDASVSGMQELGPAPKSGLGKSLALPLPDKTDNSVYASFRPIFNQQGGSCSQASSIGYVYTYEIDYLRGLPANVAGNQYPYDFTYNFINSGSGNVGGFPEDAWAIVKALGVPNVTSYGGFGLGKFTQWVSGYPIYYNAMTNRLDSYFTIKTSTAAGITQMKQWLFDHQNGSTQGGCLVMAYNASGQVLATIPAGLPEAGKKIMYQFGNSGGHAVCIAGYNDSIRYDYNGDGKYVNSDPNDVKTWEIGAFLMVNSWGTSFGNTGKVWIPYRMLADPAGAWSSQLSGMKTQTSGTFTPLLAYKIVLTHSNRSQIRLRAGYANSATATAPTGTPKTFAKAFNYSGGAYAMQGINSDAIEIGLDVSDFVPSLTNGDVSLFLLVDSKGGTGSIASFSLLDYTGGATPVELACSQTNVNIPTGTTTLKIAKTLRSLMVLTPNGGEKLERGRTFTITWFDRLSENVKLELLKGSAVVSTIAASAPSSGTYDWAVPADLALGTDYRVKISSVTTSAVCDTSDSNFSVLEKSTLQVTSPNGGEFIEKGKAFPITWNSTVVGNLKIDLYKDKMPETTLVAAVSGTGPFSWTVPATIPTGYSYSVRITSVANPLVFDESDSFFTIVNPTVKGPYSQNFDSFKAGKGTVTSGIPVGFDTLIGGWEQLSDDDLNWTVYNGPTPSKANATAGGTGPNGDHTSGTGNYLYLEASGSNSPAKSAIMLSPMVTTQSLGDIQIGFWYHMFSRDGHMGDLFVDVYADGIWADSVVHLTGDYGDVWHEQVIQLSQAFPQSTTAVSRVQVRFRGITGTAYDSDICIDDFRVAGTATHTVPVDFSLVLRPRLSHSAKCLTYSNVAGELSIVMLNGKKVMSRMVKGQGVIDISSLSKGVYCARVNGVTVRFVR
jgi:hypothetical protein